MGRYDDLIPSGSGGRYDDLIPGQPIPKSESFMQKALKTAGKTALRTGVNVMGPTGDPNPMEGMRAGVVNEIFAPAVRSATDDPVIQGAAIGGFDALFNPKTLVAGIGAKLAPKAIGNVVGSTKQIFEKSQRQPFLREQRIKAANRYGSEVETGLRKSQMSELGGVASETDGAISGLRDQSSLSVTQKLGQKQKRQTFRERALGRVENKLSQEESGLEDLRTRQADAEAVRLQRELPELYGKKTTEFGQKLRGLVGESPAEVPSGEVMIVLEDSLRRTGLLIEGEGGSLVRVRAPVSSAEQKMLNIYDSIKQTASKSTPDAIDYDAFGMPRGVTEGKPATVDIQSLFKTEGTTKQAVPFGRARKPGEQILDRTLHSLSGFLEDKVEGLRELRSSYAPYMKTKSASIRELKPFSGEYETGTASRFLSRSGGLKPDEVRFVKGLEKELGRSIGKDIETTNKGLKAVVEKKKAVRELSETHKRNIDAEIDAEVQSIKAELEKQLERVRGRGEASKEAIRQKYDALKSQAKSRLDERIRNIQLRAEEATKKYARAKFKIKAAIGATVFLGGGSAVSYIRNRITGAFSALGY